MVQYSQGTCLNLVYRTKFSRNMTLNYLDLHVSHAVCWHVLVDKLRAPEFKKNVYYW
jgi:hypothetical protein